MKHVSLNLITAVILGGILALGGCRKTQPVQNPDGTITNPNGSVTIPAQAPPQPVGVRNPDGSITNADGSVTYPPGSALAQRERTPDGFAPGTAPASRNSAIVPTPRNPAESNSVFSGASPNPSSRPSVVAPVVAPVVLTVPSGTPVRVILNGGLSARRNNVGDRFTGSLDGPLTSQGETVFPGGTAVSGEVVAAKGKGRFKGAGDLGIELTSIGRERVSTTEYERIGKGRGKRTAGFIAGGGGIGALIGGLAGGGKGALIGGLAGAGAGTAASAYTGNRDVVIPSESRITFRLTSPVSRAR